MTAQPQKITAATVHTMPFVPTLDRQVADSHFDADSEWMRDSLNMMVVGIGGLGVVNLSRRLRDLAASRYEYVQTVEQRGMAQRRSSTAAVILAANDEVAPNLNMAETDLLIGMEPLEALRFCHTLRPGSWCFLSDSRVETICGGDQKYAYPDTRDIVAEIEEYGCRCVLLPLSKWKEDAGMEPVHASSAMLGLFCAVFGFDLAMAKAMVEDKRSASSTQKNIQALEWGYSQYNHSIQMRGTFTTASAGEDYPVAVSEESMVLAGALA
ncbi:MAG: 2-oxoacid:acceptor oxidoreductase family protein [Candidatus Methylumidiphilus sp.]